MVTFILGRTQKNSSSACSKSLHLPKAWLSGCATWRSMRFLCWILLVCAPDKATLKAENLLGVGLCVWSWSCPASGFTHQLCGSLSLRLRPLLWPMSRVLAFARIRCLVDRLCRCLSQCQSLLDLLCDREHWFACFSLSLSSKGTASHTRNLRESRTRTIPDGQRSAARLSCEWISFCNGLWPDLPMARRVNYTKKLRQLVFPAACTMRLRWRSLRCFVLFKMVDGCIGTSIHLLWITSLASV